MKTMRTLLSIMLLTFALGLFAQEASIVQASYKMESPATGPKAEWDVTIADMGIIKYRTPTKVVFTLTNSGSEPLLITYAKASCGCTNLKYSKEPVMPGKSTELSVTYNGTGNGDVTKNITVQTNASSQKTVLKIKGKVVPG